MLSDRLLAVGFQLTMGHPYGQRAGSDVDSGCGPDKSTKKAYLWYWPRNIGSMDA